MCQNCISLNEQDLAYVDEPYQLKVSLKEATGDACHGIGPDKLRISFGPEHKRAEYPGDTVFDCKWEEACREHPNLVNQTMFRLHDSELVENGTAMLLKLSLTTTKEFVGTNQLAMPMRQLRRQAAYFRNDGESNAHFSSAVGCEVLLITEDEKVVLFWCTPTGMMYPERFGSREQGRFNGPSAHPEPARAGVESMKEATASVQQDIAAELFDAALRAVEERTRIPRDQLSEPRLIGSMMDSKYYKPELLFVVHTALDAAAVRALYGSSEDLDFWPVASFSDCAMTVTSITRAQAECYSAVARSAPTFGDHSFSSRAAPAEAPRPAEGADAEPARGAVWAVTGGSDKGIIIREGKDLKSQELGRLMKGAKVEEVERSDDRLHYNKLSGDGPDSGWVSIKTGDKELLKLV